MEDLENPVNLDLSLNRLAMTAVVANVYEDPVIKAKIKEIILADHVDEVNFPLRPLKREINKLAYEKLDKLLPKTLMAEADGIATIFAERIDSWACQVVTVFQLDVSYLDVIYWTSIGTIDEAKILDEYWKKHGNFTKALTSKTRQYALLPALACQHANEEIILCFQNVIMKRLRKILKRFKLTRIINKVDQIMEIYLLILYGELYDVSNSTDIYTQFKRSGKIKMEDLFKVMCFFGLPEALKHFWRFFDNVKKEAIALQLACIILEKDNVFSEYIELIFKTYSDEQIVAAKDAEILYFLINQMSPNERTTFLKRHFLCVNKIFFKVWPYQEICLKILDERWIYEKDHLCGEVLYEALRRMVLEDWFESSLCLDVFHRLLRRVMSIVPAMVKEDIVYGRVDVYYENERPIRPIETLYENFDFTSLSIIINDKDLKTERGILLVMGSDTILDLKYDGNLELLIRFMEEVLISNEERKQFMKDFKLENLLLMTDDQNIKEKVLNWQGD